MMALMAQAAVSVGRPLSSRRRRKERANAVWDRWVRISVSRERGWRLVLEDWWAQGVVEKGERAADSLTVRYMQVLPEGVTDKTSVGWLGGIPLLSLLDCSPKVENGTCLLVVAALGSGIIMILATGMVPLKMTPTRVYVISSGEYDGDKRLTK